ncbi:MAG TPA: hypothetical protein VHM31_02955 [Polyangia bacterium]|nr:hypothetical protein [Polyangia bacterium]
MTFQAMGLALVFVVIAFRALISPAQNDTFWHLRAGADIWRTGHVPTVDSYSYTAAGLPWPDHEWLWQAFSYGWYRLGGFPLLTVVVAGLILATAVLVYRLGTGAPATRAVALAVGLTLTSPVWALRPQIATMLAVALLATLLARERFWPIPLLFLLWGNVHGGVVLGGVVLVGVGAAAVVRWRRTRGAADRRRVLALALVLPLAGLATCATPLGFGVFRFVWESTSRLYALHISEWRPTWPDNTTGAIFWVAAVALLALLVRRRRALAAAPWPAWALVAAMLALMGPAFRSLRNFAPFAIVAAPAATHLLGDGFRLRWPGRAGSARAARAPAPDHPRVNLAIAAVMAAAALALVAGAYAVRLPWLAWQPIAPRTLAAVESCRAPLFNHYDDGGPLIWFAPDRPVFVDSRQDPYPLPFMLEAIAVERGEQPYAPLFARWGIGCAFLKASSKMTDRLRADGWQTRALDADWAVLARPGTP